MFARCEQPFELTMSLSKQKVITNLVREFYALLPFNFEGSVQQQAQTIAADNPITVYPEIDRILRYARQEDDVLEIGCGAGWFTNSAAFHYSPKIYGVDLCLPALERAWEVSRHLGLSGRVAYAQVDLFAAPFARQFFFVNSIGVLHHTYDCFAALRAITEFVKDGGYLHIGLYHLYGRKPFLDLFQRYRERLLSATEAEKEEIEEESLSLFAKLFQQEETDRIFLRSWFRDQALHPHETQHTFEEVYGWLSSLGFKVLSTSINRFQPIHNPAILFEQEKEMYELARRVTYDEKRYFPGFFVILAQKTSGENGVS
jgi:SAM-dependent methyltransferase